MNAVLDQLNTIKNTSNNVDEILMATKLLNFVSKVKASDFTAVQSKMMLYGILRAHTKEIKDANTANYQFWKDLIGTQHYTAVLTTLLN